MTPPAYLPGEPLVHPLNTNGCCDGRGSVHHGFGALAYRTECMDPGCMAQRRGPRCVDCSRPVYDGDLCSACNRKRCDALIAWRRAA